MSNPTTGTWQFAGSLDGGPNALAGIDPIRYSDGLWLEQGATNLFRDPLLSGGTGWTASGPGVGSATPKTDDGHGDLFCMEISGNTGDTGARMTTTNVATPFASPALIHTLSFDARNISGNNRWRVTAFEFNVANSLLVTTPAALVFDADTAWGAMYICSYLPTNGSTAYVLFGFRRGLPSAGVVRVDNIQIEVGGYATSHAHGAIGAGYTLNGDGSSTRAASSAAISPAGILSPASGAIATRITPTIETGLEELWGECGVKGSGTDHLRWGRDASKHPFVEWSSNDAAYQRLTATETISAGQERTIVLGHDGTDISLSVGDGAVQTDTRDTVSGSFGAGDLVLEASAGGVIYDEFATFDRTLTTSEIARLNAASAWSMTTVAARRIQQQFQLRPY